MLHLVKVNKIREKGDMKKHLIVIQVKLLLQSIQNCFAACVDEEVLKGLAKVGNVLGIPEALDLQHTCKNLKPRQYKLPNEFKLLTAT